MEERVLISRVRRECGLSLEDAAVAVTRVSGLADQVMARHGFRVLPGGDRFEQRDGQHVRIVTDARIVETSIVTFPSYTATDASVAQRALRAYREQHGARVDWLRLRLAVSGG